MKIIYVLIASLLCFFMAFFVISPEFIATLMTLDDSYFYIKIAANMAKGLGSTFDGIAMTNGYHPLYFFILTGLSYFFPLTGLAQLPILLFFESLLLILLSGVVFSFLKVLSFSRFYRYLVTTSIILSIGLYDIGLETRLNILLIFLLLRSCYDFVGNFHFKTRFLIAILMPLCFLARIDNLILIFCLGTVFVLLHLYNKERPLSFFRTMMMGVPLLLTLLLYALLNKHYFGIYSSISSLVKLSRPDIAIMSYSPQTLLRWVGILVISLLFGCFFLYRQLKNEPHTFFKKARNISLLSLFFFNIFYLMVLAVKGHMIMNWYFLLPLSFAFIFCGEMCQRLMEQKQYSRFRPYAPFLCGLLLMAFPCFYPVHRILKWQDFNMQHLELALWIKKNLSPEARIYQVDRSGRTGFISERYVINGDGLVNSFDYYQDVLIGDNLQDYVKKWGIDYYIFYRNHDLQRLKLSLKKSTQLLFYNDYFALVKATDISSIWKL